jgi:hypothetical protein
MKVDWLIFFIALVFGLFVFLVAWALSNSYSNVTSAMSCSNLC